MFTKSDLTKLAKTYGYSVKFTDGEIEAYPKNMRGDASFFESDDEGGRVAILATIKADFSSRYSMTIKAMTHNTTGDRFLCVDEGLIPIGIASMCVDPRISGFEIKCTECRVKYPVRLLNEGGYCEACVNADFESCE